MKASKQANPPEILHILGSASSAAPESTSSAAVDGRGGRGRSQTPSGWERRQGVLSNSKWMGEAAGGALKLQVDGRGGRGRSQTPSGWERRQGALSNSKHWFTTSFLQPLLYLVTPQGPENCQLTSSFLLVLKQ